ncbi:MAG: flagellar hook-associated protein FlgL [Planctomycetes bacterium]|nr:flagellar hook-associated protein FlgL [Planctomycetota bacterium]
MRITQSLLYRHQADALTSAYLRLFDVQAQLSSGRRLLKPSDDPSSIRPALDVRAGRRRLEQVRKNAELASSELGTAEGILRNASDIVARAQEIAVSGANGSLNQGDRNGLAIEVDGLLKQLLSLANSRGLSGHLFGGGLRTSAPFEEVQTADGSVVMYRGDQATSAVDLGDSLELELNIPGSSIFGIGTRGTTVYSGSTGAAAGSGNDSARGTDRLTVAHGATTLGDGALAGGGDSASGVVPGASSAAGDTLLGPAGVWSLTVVDTSGTGAAGTVSLNGGPPVSWTAADRDLAVTAADGTLVHLDMGNVTAGFNGAVAAEATGTLSLDGGLTSSAIDFTADNQLVVDSETGASLFVDSRGIQRAGAEVLRFEGAYDLFSALVELRDSLNNVDGDVLDTQLDRIRGTIAEFSRGEDTLLAALSSFGARMRLADTTRSRADELDLLLAQNQSSLEDVDFAAASIELTQSQLVLQAGVAISGRIANLPSLTQIL